MKRKKGIWIFTIATLIFIIISYLIVKSWTTTNYGKLHIRIAIMLKIKKYINPNSINNKSINDIRNIIDKDFTRWNTEPIYFSNIKNLSIPTSSIQIPVRIYTPQVASKLPVIIYSHGGSWIGGSLNTHDNICRKLSQNTNAIVISVDYRLAPENPFPAGLNDVYTVLQWTYKNAESINGNSAHIALVGDSSGANLSAAASLMERDKNGSHIACQVLVYPSTNIFELNSKSWSYFANDFNLSMTDMQKYISLYVPKKEDRINSYASPLLAKNFKGLPDTLIITAEFDPLRDEGETYAEKLKEAGVKVAVTRYKSVTHGFLLMNQITSESDKALNQISSYLQKEL
ncbi:alpha/beta hydrolase [Clostridium kluyveri]|uniref:Predicted esterase n=2 Tax=Clostridium kluyveri TaxID=1534 RepID=A5N5G3_CLOK5|nr:alpha/beta hydrolase [Clostridium kluyveri]EDK32544.1 Predicted esterase [Clostridium kluyveri DSM 555]BAH05481.1 hypothetical protein CKR_0430 [Clostridium kluyveri NBRC 12016]